MLHYHVHSLKQTDSLRMGDMLYYHIISLKHNPEVEVMILLHMLHPFYVSPLYLNTKIR